eukprot:scaffold694_cov338-Pavlova_lutheri.AAC.31
MPCPLALSCAFPNPPLPPPCGGHKHTHTTRGALGIPCFRPCSTVSGRIREEVFLGHPRLEPGFDLLLFLSRVWTSPYCSHL